jgi:hypothetical protein
MGLVWVRQSDTDPTGSGPGFTTLFKYWDHNPFGYLTQWVTHESSCLLAWN